MAVPSATTASYVLWDDLLWPDLERGSLKLMLPKGALPRPPTVHVEVWDADLPEENNPLAAGEVRLGGSEGHVASAGSRKLLLRPTQPSLEEATLAFGYSAKALQMRAP